MLVEIARKCDLIGIFNLSVTCKQLRDLLHDSLCFPTEVSKEHETRPCKETVLKDSFVPLVLDPKTSILPQNDGQFYATLSFSKRMVWREVRKNKSPKATCSHCGWIGDIRPFINREGTESRKWNNHAKMEVERQNGKYSKRMQAWWRWKAWYLFKAFMDDCAEKGWFEKRSHGRQVAT